MSYFEIFNRARDGINVNMRGLTTAANNIANINTPGYSRQRVVVQSRDANVQTGVGGGVEFVAVERTVDRFLQLQLLTLANDQGTLEGRKGTIDTMEALFSESEESGLSKNISEYFNSWRDLSQNPNSLSARNSLLEKARNLISEFNTKSTEIKKVLRNLSDQISSHTSTVNRLLRQVADLNDTIVAQEAGTQAEANDLRDQRTQAMQELSAEINVSFFENDIGALNVFLDDGTALVNGNQYTQLSLSDDLSYGGNATVNWTDTNGASSLTLDVTSSISSGYIGGLLAERNTNVQNILSDLDSLAYNVINQVNNLHFSGYGLDGSTNNNFFTSLASSNDAASLMALDVSVSTDPRTIAAASGDPTAGSGVGDNGVALNIAALENALTMQGGTQKFGDFYNDIMSDIGISANEINQSLTAKNEIYEATRLQRESVSGVSLDEEGADLIRYQRAFEASVRLMKIAGELVESILAI